MPKPLHALSLALVALVCACGAGLDPRLEPLASAPLEVGRGLGELTLGETTLGQVIERYGTGRVALVAGDETAYELSFADGQLDLLFKMPQEWCWDGPPLRQGVHDLQVFVGEYPEFVDLTLTSLAVSIDRFSGDSFYQGSLSRGGRLTGSIADVLSGYGPPPGGPGLFVAGMSPSNSDERALYADLGLQVHYRTPEQEDDEEPEPAAIESITLFLPGAP